MGVSRLGWQPGGDYWGCLDFDGNPGVMSGGV